MSIGGIVIPVKTGIHEGKEKTGFLLAQEWRPEERESVKSTSSRQYV